MSDPRKPKPLSDRQRIDVLLDHIIKLRALIAAQRDEIDRLGGAR